jgi:hypothetical protein
MPHKKTKNLFSRLQLGFRRRIHGFLGSRKAVSVVVSTVVLSAGVLALGIAVLYWAYSWGNLANLQYSKTVATNSYAVAERIGFEYISYSSSSRMLTVNIINCGGANNLNISLVHLTDIFHNYVGTGAYAPSSLTNITSGSPVLDNDLDIGEEGRFTVNLSGPLPDGYYNIRIVTGRGRNFDSSFVTP